MKSLALIPISLLVSFSVAASPVVTEDYKYYRIYPDSSADIKSALYRQSPVRENGNVYFGHTDWSVNWYISMRSEGRVCGIAELTTELNVNYTVPRLGASRVDETTKTVFDKFYRALLNHEKGHMRNGLRAIKEIEKVLGSLRTQKNCRRLERVANKKVTAILKEYKHKDRIYDKLTRHGYTQGAVIK